MEQQQFMSDAILDLCEAVKLGFAYAKNALENTNHEGLKRAIQDEINQMQAAFTKANPEITTT